MTSEQPKQKDATSQSEDNMNAADSWDDWDDIQLTPVKSTGSAKEKSKKTSPGMSEDQLKTISDNISTAFRELDDSFMYLGVLKKLPLPEATKFFEEKFLRILKLFEKVWKSQAYPEKDTVFSSAGEDFSKLNKLIHSGDAVEPIYEGLKTVYENVEQFRDSGMSQPDAIKMLKEIYQNRK